MEVKQIPKPRLRCASREEEYHLEHLDDLIDDDHLVRIVWAFVEQLDLSELYAQIKAVEGKPGSPAIDAKILLALWLYATLDHETHARRIARLCKTHNAYIWLCGGVNVNYHTLSDFHTQNGTWLDKQFTLHIASLQHQGLVDFNRVAQDGMRVRADAGAASFRRKKSLEECLKDSEEYLEILRQEKETDPTKRSKRQQAAQERAARERCERITKALDQLPEIEKKKKKGEKDKARVSTTDPDVRIMKMADGGFRPALNVQFSTDTNTQIIVGVDVVNTGSDQNQLSPMLEQVHKRTGNYPKEALVDGGFVNKDEVEKCEKKGITFYGPVPKPKDKNRERYEPMPSDSKVVGDWRKRMGTDEAKIIYKDRAATAECVNAIARNRGLKQFCVRSVTKVKTALLWFVFAHNIMREVSLRPMAA